MRTLILVFYVPTSHSTGCLAACFLGSLGSDADALEPPTTQRHCLEILQYLALLGNLETLKYYSSERDSSMIKRSVLG